MEVLLLTEEHHPLQVEIIDLVEPVPRICILPLNYGSQVFVHKFIHEGLKPDNDFEEMATHSYPGLCRSVSLHQASSTYGIYLRLAARMNLKLARTAVHQKTVKVFALGAY